MSNVVSLVPNLMLQCLVGLPVILVWLVGGVIIAMRARNNQTAVFMALGGIILAALDFVSGMAASMVPVFLLGRDMTASSMGMVLSGIGVVRNLVGAVSWGLILAALAMALGKPAGQDGPIGED